MRNGAILEYYSVKEAFREWLDGRIDKRTWQDYLTYLDRFVGKRKIRTPEDIADIVAKASSKKHISNALRNLINFYVEVKGLDENTAQKLKKACKIPQVGVRAVFIQDSELREAAALIKSKGNREAEIFFKLLAYSGIRASHAYELLTSFDRAQLITIPEKGIARYPIFEFGKGKKRGYFAYMPLELAEELKQITGLSYRYLVDTIRTGRVSANTLRKWQFNKLIEAGIDSSVADFIQGRAPASVGAMHYLATARQADTAYSRALPLLQEVLE
ncbi:integrase [Geoglobus sp.]